MFPNPQQTKKVPNMAKTKKTPYDVKNLTAANISVAITQEVCKHTGINRYMATVSVVGLGLDREYCWGMSLGEVGPKSAAIGARLRAWLESGRAFDGGTVLVDMDGDTYFSPNWVMFPMGRRLNADLRKVGF